MCTHLECLSNMYQSGIFKQHVQTWHANARCTNSACLSLCIAYAYLLELIGLLQCKSKSKRSSGKHKCTFVIFSFKFPRPMETRRELAGCDTQLVPNDPAGRAKEARTGARDVAGRGC